MRSLSSLAERGFSLLEITVALAILAGLTGIAGVALAPARDRLRLEADVRELALWLEQARGQALLRAEPISIRFDAAASRFIAGPIHPPGPVLAGTIYFDGLDPASNAALTFWPDGSATGAVLQIGESAWGARITVDTLTGRVRLAATSGGGKR